MSTTQRDSSTTFSLPTNSVGYVAIGAAVVTGVLHLVLGIVFLSQGGISSITAILTQTLPVLFILNGIGFLGGIGVYLSQYWRRELHLIAAGYAGATIVAFFIFNGGFSPVVAISKIAEVTFIISVLYLYTTE
jgi:hypothetical protein